MISVRNLEKRYGEIRAVSGLSFEVERGEIVGLLGHNGAGKTTVMKVMTGFLEPTAGTVLVGGVDVVADRLAVQRQIGYLPENAPLYPEMLVQEYLLMMAELRRIPAEKRVAAVADAVRATGLEGRLVQPIATLSKGYRQRVGLAQAILHRPEVLVLDEPTNGLDPVQIVEIRDLIRRLAKTSTVILSTHILSEIEAVCDRAVILIDGELAADRRLAELLQSDVIRVAVGEGARDVPRVLGAVEGVRSVTRDGERGGYAQWRVECAPGADPAPAIAAAAHTAGWKLGQLSPETQSLEQVFRDLMTRHVSRARTEKTKTEKTEKAA
ncbi:MAG: ATP-binding cassette domain-containing protein [bacterium]|nr:ATP-binding cassette domain-containing protein [Myxococcales bacterium]MCB9542348.1 ATP-binding cassette domain-containing protein [Myxococcales bacterium]MCB9552016.1 ATP-binding cassette domain-containing protein [Myxococcales bacterium]